MWRKPLIFLVLGLTGCPGVRNSKDEAEADLGLSDAGLGDSSVDDAAVDMAPPCEGGVIRNGVCVPYCRWDVHNWDGCVWAP